MSAASWISFLSLSLKLSKLVIRKCITIPECCNSKMRAVRKKCIVAFRNFIYEKNAERIQFGSMNLNYIFNEKNGGIGYFAKKDGAKKSVLIVILGWVQTWKSGIFRWIYFSSTFFTRSIDSRSPVE